MSIKTKIFTEELQVNSDLSAISLARALDMLDRGGRTYETLTCASQNIGVALPLIAAFDFNMSFNLNIEYGPDEWSVESHKYVDGGWIINRIHSEGA